MVLEDNGLQVNSLTHLEAHTVVGHTQADREHIQEASIQDLVRYHQGNTSSLDKSQDNMFKPDKDPDNGLTVNGFHPQEQDNGSMENGSRQKVSLLQEKQSKTNTLTIQQTTQTPKS